MEWVEARSIWREAGGCKGRLGFRRVGLGPPFIRGGPRPTLPPAHAFRHICRPLRRLSIPHPRGRVECRDGSMNGASLSVLRQAHVSPGSPSNTSCSGSGLAHPVPHVPRTGVARRLFPAYREANATRTVAAEEPARKRPSTDSIYRRNRRRRAATSRLREDGPARRQPCLPRTAAPKAFRTMPRAKDLCAELEGPTCGLRALP